MTKISYRNHDLDFHFFIDIQESMLKQSKQSSLIIQKINKIHPSNTVVSSQDFNSHVKYSVGISQQKIQLLIHLVTKRHLFIKDAARKVGISYGTAKKIYKQFRVNILTKNKFNQQNNNNVTIRATYTQIKTNSNPISIINLFAGKTIQN